MHQEILDRQAALQDLFDEVSRLQNSGAIDTDLAAQLTWYLCIRTSGFLENAVQVILLEYVQSKTVDVPTQNFVEENLMSITARYDVILGTVRRFNEDWRTQLRQNDVQKYKRVLNNLVKNRNLIAHGRDSKITIQELQSYFVEIKDLVRLLHRTCKSHNGSSSTA